MIEKIIRDYLLTKITVPVYIEQPDERKPTYVVIERTGGGLENHIRQATLAVQSIAESQYKAALLHETVMDAVLQAVELDSIGGIYLNAEYNFPNEETKEHRYQAVFNITHY